VSLWDGRLRDMMKLSVPAVPSHSSEDGRRVVRPAAKSLPPSVMDALRGVSLDLEEYDDGSATSTASVVSSAPDVRDARGESLSIAEKLAKCATTIQASLQRVQSALEAGDRDVSRDGTLLDAALRCVEAQTSVAWLASKHALGTRPP
jgi:hypothetical protein